MTPSPRPYARPSNPPAFESHRSNYRSAESNRRTSSSAPRNSSGSSTRPASSADKGQSTRPWCKRSSKLSNQLIFGEHVAGRLLGSAALDAETGGKAYRAARQEATDFTERVNHAFSDVDALVMPTIRTLAPERDKMDTTEDMLTLLGNTAPFNIAGTPPQPSLSPKWTASPSARKSSLRGSEIFTTLAIGDRLHDEKSASP